PRVASGRLEPRLCRMERKIPRSTGTHRAGASRHAVNARDGSAGVLHRQLAVAHDVVALGHARQEALRGGAGRGGGVLVLQGVLEGVEQAVLQLFELGPVGVAGVAEGGAGLGVHLAHRADHGAVVGGVAADGRDLGAQARHDLVLVLAHAAEQRGELGALHLAGGFGIELRAVARDLDQVVEGVLDLPACGHANLLWGKEKRGDHSRVPAMRPACSSVVRDGGDSRVHARCAASLAGMDAARPALYLVYVDVDVARHAEPSPDLLELAPGLYLTESTRTRSQVYHAIKRRLQPRRLLVAPLADDPKFKGMAP